MRIDRYAILLAALLPLSAAASGPVCNKLGDRHDSNLDLNIQMQRGELIVERKHAEYLRIDRSDRVFVDGKPLEVPVATRAKVEEYRLGFDKVRDEAWEIGKAGGRIGVSAVTGLIGAFFSTKTMEEYEQEIEAKAEAIEARAEVLCSTVLDLERIETELVDGLPGFPRVLTAGARFDL